MTESLLAQIQRKFSKFGIWKKCTCILHHQELVLTKSEKSRIVHFRTDVIPGFQISIPSTKSCKILKIKNPSKKSSISLKFSSKQLASVWYNALLERLDLNRSFLSKPILTLGKGFFSTVDLVQFHDQYIAQKEVLKKVIEKHKLEESVYAERDCMVKCEHPFIVQLHYCYQTSTTFYYGMDFLPGGDLYALTCRKKFSLFDVKLYLCEIGMALTYLHSKGFVYRDLKPENILIDKDGHIKLSDFGLAKNIKKEGMTKTFCGTNCYMAPEMLSGSEYDFMVDWWSFGVLAYQLLCKKM
jgi:tRNA A-37 threonylcarbamoyl transferase component Bud32